jgi:hypothetical protein
MAGLRHPPAHSRRQRQAVVLERQLHLEAGDTHARLAEARAMLTALDNRRQRRGEEFQLEVSHAATDRLVATRAYHAELERIEEQEIRLKGLIGRLDRTAQHIASRLKELDARRAAERLTDKPASDQ